MFYDYFFSFLDNISSTHILNSDISYFFSLLIPGVLLIILLKLVLPPRVLLVFSTILFLFYSALIITYRCKVGFNV